MTYANPKETRYMRTVLLKGMRYIQLFAKHHGYKTREVELALVSHLIPMTMYLQFIKFESKLEQADMNNKRDFKA